jgi:hypothetical protein
LLAATATAPIGVDANHIREQQDPDMPAGEPTHDFTSPNWAPLYVSSLRTRPTSFMWVHRCVHADGFRLEAYKHRISRPYLYLSDGVAFMAGEDEALHLVDVRSALGTIADSLERPRRPRPTTPVDDAARLQEPAARRRHPGGPTSRTLLVGGVAGAPSAAGLPPRTDLFPGSRHRSRTD